MKRDMDDTIDRWPRVRKALRYVLIVGLSLTLVLTIFAVSVTSLDDPVSTWLRAGTEKYLNAYIAHLTDKAREDRLSFFDRGVLHAGALTGISVCRLLYPEAAQILYHYVYGNGDTLELSPDYFRESEYLKGVVDSLGPGEHHRICLKKRDDERIWMALNPYYLSITTESVRIYHPELRFAAVSGDKVRTPIPIGRVTLIMYDNLVSAMNPTPFYVYSEWEID